MIRHKTKVILIVAVIYLVVSSLGLWWISNKITTAGETLESRVLVIANKIAQEQKYDELVELVESTKVTRDSLNEYVLTEDKTIDFLAEIEQIGVNQGITLETDSLEIIEDPGLFDTLSIRFTLSGNEARVFRVLKMLETIPYHSQLQEMNFNDVSDDTSQTVLKVKLAVSLKSI